MSPEGRRSRALLFNQQCPNGKSSEHTVLGKVLGQGEDGVQIGKTYRFMLGRIILLSDGRVVYSRHVHIDERPALRPTCWLYATADTCPWESLVVTHRLRLPTTWIYTSH